MRKMQFDFRLGKGDFFQIRNRTLIAFMPKKQTLVDQSHSDAALGRLSPGSIPGKKKKRYISGERRGFAEAIENKRRKDQKSLRC